MAAIEIEVISIIRKGGKNTRYLVLNCETSQPYSILISNDKGIELGMRITVQESDLVASKKNVQVSISTETVLPLNILKEVLVRISKKTIPNENITPIYGFSELTAEQRRQLENGSGHTNIEDEITQINSSTAFCINFYKAFEEVIQKNDPKFQIEFEWRDSIPLLRSQAPANIDVKYELNNTVYFVECKFLEPYYMHVKPNSAAYCNPSRYPHEESAEVWASLCNEINNAVTDIDQPLTNFDAPQICRHLIAVYRHYKDYPNKYRGKKIIVQSMSWKMPDSFGKLTTDWEAAKKICSNIDIELKKYAEIINKSIRKLDWNCNFEFKHYNNELEMIRTSSKFEEICEQYLLEK